MCDKHNLNRFIKAQLHTYDTVLNELHACRKETHWMWFIFPQIHGLGHSNISKLYSIKNKDEAIDYINHPVLGVRLRECTAEILRLNDEGYFISELLGSTDYEKLRSSMTLFLVVSGDLRFKRVIDEVFFKMHDPVTLRKLTLLNG